MSAVVSKGWIKKGSGTKDKRDGPERQIDVGERTTIIKLSKEVKEKIDYYE